MPHDPGGWRTVRPAPDGGGAEIRVADHKDALAYSAAKYLAALLEASVRERGRASIALSGGTTPRKMYELLTAVPRQHRFWDRVDFVFGDERAVPPDHPDSNFAMAREALRPFDLDVVPLERLHRIRGELGAAEAARDYERTLRALFPEAAADPARPILDVALQGVGDDGHTASLFPGDPVLEVRDRWVATATAPAAFPVRERVTLTVPALGRSRVVCFLCAGAGKAEVLRRILVEREDLPAGRVRGLERTVWLLDKGAAAKL